MKTNFKECSEKLVEHLKAHLDIKSTFGTCCNCSIGLFELIFRSDEGARKGTIFINVDGKVEYFSKVVVCRTSDWRVYNDFFKVLEFVSRESFAPYFRDLCQLQPETWNYKYLSLRREVNQIHTAWFRVTQAFKGEVLTEKSETSGEAAKDF